MTTTEAIEKQSEHKSTERARRKRRAKRRNWIVFAVILVLVGAGAGYYYLYYQPSQVSAETEDAEMQTATVRVGDLELYANGAGELIPADEADLAFSSSAEVSAVYVEVGDRVTAGQVLVELDPTDLQEAYFEAQRDFNEIVSPASIAQAKQNAAQLEEEVGDAVSTLQWLISPSTYYYEEKLEEAQAALVEAKAGGDGDTIAEAERQVANAENGLKQAAYYYENTYGPEQFEVESCEGSGPSRTCETDVYFPSEAEINDARFTLELYEAQLQEAQDYLTLLTTGELPENATGSDVNAYLTALDGLETAQENLESYQLLAPFDGLVTAVNVKVGDEAGTGTAIILIDNTSLFLEVYLDGSDWDMFHLGYEADIIFDSYPDSVFAGTVVRVDPFLTESMGATVIGGLVELDKTDLEKLARLPIGSTADVNVIAGRAEKAILVPVEALRQVTDETYSVFVVNENEELELRMVEVGLVDVYYAEVISGLEQGEVVSTGIVETE